MSNLKDFIGGGSSTFATYQVVGDRSDEKTITDGTHTINNPFSNYDREANFEKLETGSEYIVAPNGANEIDMSNVTESELLEYSYRSSANLTTTLDNPEYTQGYEFLSLNCSELNILENTKIVVPSRDYSTLGGSGFISGIGGRVYDPVTVGTADFSTTWDFMPKGGSSSGSWESAVGGYGVSAGGSGRYTTSSGGNNAGDGGGLVFIVADKVFGTGVIEAKGGVSFSTTGISGGGGGMILIITKEWSGEVSLDVSGGTGTIAGGLGSYAILRRNSDDSLTLMVYSENGVSADLNGQTPIHGADASIAW